MKWCPSFTDCLDATGKKQTSHPQRKRNKNNAQNSETSSSKTYPEIIGILALATVNGQIIFYRFDVEFKQSIFVNLLPTYNYSIPKDLNYLDTYVNKNENCKPANCTLPDSVVVLSSEPLFILKHPPLFLKNAKINLSELQNDEPQQQLPNKKRHSLLNDSNKPRSTEQNDRVERLPSSMITSAPFLHIDWSPFMSSRHVAVISSTCKSI